MRAVRRLLGRGSRGESGQGLGFLLVASAILLILLVALVDVIRHEMRWIVGSQRRSKLLYGADAALEKAVYQLQRGANWDALPLTDYNDDFTHTDVPGVKYTIKIQEGNWTPYADLVTAGIISSEADYTPCGNRRTERTVTILVSYTTTGERKKVQGIVLKSGLNSAMYSEGVLAIGGSAEVYWGPVVSYDAVNGMAVDKSCKLPTHPIFVSRGPIYLAGGKTIVDCGYADDPDPYAGVSGNQYASDTELGDAPDVPIDDYRQEAKTLDGDPDWTDPKGVYKYHNAVPGKTSWSFTSMTDPAWPAKTVFGETTVFFDTDDGLPCNGTDGSCIPTKSKGTCTNCVTVKFTGGKNCGAGTFVIMGDLEMGGTGVCSWKAQPPSDCAKLGGPCTPSPYPITGGWWEGDIWVAGRLDGAGDKKVYGTVGVGDAASGTGGVEIWFKSGSATLGKLGQSMGVKYWRERKPEAWDVFP